MRSYDQIRRMEDMLQQWTPKTVCDRPAIDTSWPCRCVVVVVGGGTKEEATPVAQLNLLHYEFVRFVFRDLLSVTILI